MDKQQLKTLFPTYTETELDMISEYLKNYNVNDEIKIRHIENLYKLMNIFFSEFIEKS